MHLETIRVALRFMPLLWFGLAALGLASSRAPRLASLALYAAAYFVSAFLTRLAVEHHQSRSQIACFALGALIVEMIRSRHLGGFSAAFWIVATAASALGVAAARPIAHRYNVSTW